MPLNLRVATLNLLNALTSRQPRAPLVVYELNTRQPDLIALPEVVLPGRAAQWLADRVVAVAAKG